MKDLILKWWNREWSNWELDGINKIFEKGANYPWKIEEVYKRVSNDGIAQIKKVRRL